MPPLQPIDAHAHVLTGIAERDLRALRALVFAVTREPDEWGVAASRRDRGCVWGLGLTPAFRARSKASTRARLNSCSLEPHSSARSALTTARRRRGTSNSTSFGRCSSSRPRRPAWSAFTAASRCPGKCSPSFADDPSPARFCTGGAVMPARPPRRSSLAVTSSAERCRGPQPEGPVTCPRRPGPDRDRFPHSRRSDRAADKPGAVQTIEIALAATWACTVDELRERLWQNLAQLCAATRTASLMPRDTQATLLAL